MHTDATPKEMPTGDGNPTAGHTDKQTLSNTADSDKAFANLRAAYALRGHTINRVAARDGIEAYWAERWGLVRYLPSLHDAALFLAQIGGRL